MVRTAMGWRAKALCAIILARGVRSSVISSCPCVPLAREESLALHGGKEVVGRRPAYSQEPLHIQAGNGPSVFHKVDDLKLGAMRGRRVRVRPINLGLRARSVFGQYFHRECQLCLVGVEEFLQVRLGVMCPCATTPHGIEAASRSLSEHQQVKHGHERYVARFGSSAPHDGFFLEQQSACSYTTGWYPRTGRPSQCHRAEGAHARHVRRRESSP